MNNRDMFYQNLNQGYTNPGQYIPPSGYNMNTQYQAFGPNVAPYQNNQNNYMSFEQSIDERLNKIDRQIRNLDTRLQKLENSTTETINDNIYMI